MTHQTIKEKIQSLNALTADLNPDTFKEKLYCAYRTKLLKDLEGCESPQDFERVLATNWAQVIGTALCYTARPEDDLTLLLCEIAEDISKELQITKLTKEEKLKVAPICLLMPDVVTESIYSEKDIRYGDYPNLTELPLKQVLKTHILSDSGCHLIAVRTVLELPGPWENNGNSLPMYYDDFTGKAEQHFVTKEELNRLRRHSAHTEGLFAAKEDYEALLKDAGFLSHLQTLIKVLTANSTSGMGTEEVAGQGAYEGLQKFTQYYQMLGDNVNEIPEDLKSALDELISISSDPEKHRTATIDQSCINARHQALSKLVQDNLTKLINIGVDNTQKAQLLHEAQVRFAGNKETLKTLLAEAPPAYTGQEPLGLTHSLLNTYGVIPEITSLRAFQDFLTLNPEEIKQIAEIEPAVQAGILEHFTNLEDLVLFCLTTPFEPLKAIVTVIGKPLSNKLISTPKDISTCLMLMEGPRLALMMQLLAERLPIIIKSGYHFGHVLYWLSPEQRTAVYQTVKLPTIIKSGVDFEWVLRYLTPEQRTAVYEAFKTRLPTRIIQSGVDFGLVLEFLNIEQRIAVYDSLKDQLQTLIISGEDFRWVLRYLNSEQRTVVYEAVKTQLRTTIIQNGVDFGLVLEFLSVEQRSAVYETCKAQLPCLINSGLDLGRTLQHLSLEQCAAVCTAVKAQLPTIIQSGYHFGQVFRYLSREQCSTVCESLKGQLHTLLKNGNDFGWALRYLNPEQCGAVCEALKAQLPTVIKNRNDCSGVLLCLDPEQCRAVCEALKAHLVSIIKTVDDFKQVVEPLNHEQRMVFFNLFKTQLREKIDQGVDLYNLPDWLASEECLKTLGCTPHQTQALQVEIRLMLERAHQMLNKTFCANFDSRRNQISQMQRIENHLQNMQLDDTSRDNVPCPRP